MTNDMNEKILKQVVVYLNRLEAKFTIELPDGHIETNIKRRAPNKYPIGEITDYIKNQIIEPLQEGDFGIVRCGDYEIDTIASSMSAYFTRVYGGGKISTSRKKEANEVTFEWLVKKQPESEEIIF
jgi:hypothetical protein